MNRKDIKKGIPYVSGDGGVIGDVVLTCLEKVGIAATFRLENSGLWDETLSRLDFIPVAYSQAELDYQLAYIQGGGLECQDISLILYQDNRPCGIWPLYFALCNGQGEFGGGQFMLPPLFIGGVVDRTKKSLIKKCLDFAVMICKELHIDKWRSAESYVGDIGLSDWHEQSLRRGASVSLRHELFVDLELDIANIKAKFRKSYKSLIAEGMRVWKVDVLKDAANPELWESFRMLHQKVAGRVTRSIETWDLQYQAIAGGDAFLVHLHNVEGELVGGGYFAITRDQGVYNVAAYDRTLFAQPLGHVVQYRAIEEMKARGLLWYKIGLRSYKQDKGVTEKEVAISEFKQGFSTHLFPQYLLQHNVEII
jgi:FemAB family protein